MVNGDLLRVEYGLSLTLLDNLKPADAIVLAVAHRARAAASLVQPLLRSSAGFVADVPGLLDRLNRSRRRHTLATLAPPPSAVSARPCRPAGGRLPSDPFVAPTNTLAPTLASALSPGEKVTIGTRGFTLTVCVPSLYFGVSVHRRLPRRPWSRGRWSIYDWATDPMDDGLRPCLVPAPERPALRGRSSRWRRSSRADAWAGSCHGPPCESANHNSGQEQLDSSLHPLWKTERRRQP